MATPDKLLLTLDSSGVTRFLASADTAVSLSASPQGDDSDSAAWTIHGSTRLANAAGQYLCGDPISLTVYLDEESNASTWTFTERSDDNGVTGFTVALQTEDGEWFLTADAAAGTVALSTTDSGAQAEWVILEPSSHP